MRTYTDIIPRPVVHIAPAVQQSRFLFCEVEQTWTRHELTASQTHYVCGCGSQVIYIVNNAPHLWAV